MGTLALLLLIVWAVGVLLTAWGLAILLKEEDNPMSEKIWTLYEQAPFLTVGALAVTTVFWPATLLFNIVVGTTKGNTE